MIPGLGVVCRLAVEEDGVRAAAVLDGNGEPVVSSGRIDGHDLRTIRRHAVTRAMDNDEAAKLFAGGAIAVALGDERRALVTVARRCLFVVVVDDRDEPIARERLDALRVDVEELIDCARRDLGLTAPAPGSGGTGSGSGPEPAELQHVELGVTVPRRRPS